MPVGDNIGYVEFNFSIPKLIYGTNVIQFVPHTVENSGFWNVYLHADYKWNQKVCHKRLTTFLRRFFNTYFFNVESDVDFNDIEIRRFDVCWNQYFNCKEDALKYLNYQKQVKKKNLRVTSKNKHSFPTSVFFSSKDYGAKIYHKGTEYRSPKGEMKHHKEVNRLMAKGKDGIFDEKKRRVSFDVEKIAAHADKILRYEITFRHSYISKIFWSKVFRIKDRAWNKRMEKWNEYRKIYDRALQKNKLTKEKREFWFSVWTGRVDYNSEFAKEMIKNNHYRFLFVDLKVGLNRSQRNFFNWWRKAREKRIPFNCKVSDHVWRFNHGYGNKVDIGDGIQHEMVNEARFSPALLSECFRIFNKFREHFKIEQRTGLYDSINKADKYNHDVEEHNKLAERSGGIIEKRTKLQLAKAKPILLMLQTHSLDYLVENKIISRWTAKRYENKLKVIDLNFRTGSIENLWNCRSFNEYHTSLQMDGLTKYLNNHIFD